MNNFLIADDEAMWRTCVADVLTGKCEVPRGNIKYACNETEAAKVLDDHLWSNERTIVFVDMRFEGAAINRDQVGRQICHMVKKFRYRMPILMTSHPGTSPTRETLQDWAASYVIKGASGFEIDIQNSVERARQTQKRMSDWEGAIEEGEKLWRALYSKCREAAVGATEVQAMGNYLDRQRLAFIGLLNERHYPIPDGLKGHTRA